MNSKKDLDYFEIFKAFELDDVDLIDSALDQFLKKKNRQKLSTEDSFIIWRFFSTHIGRAVAFRLLLRGCDPNVILDEHWRNYNFQTCKTW